MLTTEVDTAQLAVVRAIYEDAFPADLRADFDSLLDDRLVVRVAEGGAPEGLAVLRPLGGTGWVFLRYYAVGVRGGGVGTAMLGELAALLTDEGCSLLVWDVEDPDEPGLAAHEVEEHRRRIAFYERAGGLLLPVRDYAPPHGDDLDDHAPHLRLMCLPLGGASAPAPRDVLLAAMTLRYELEPDHPAVLRALDSLG
ncbi:GNAT family N-acetyltransferase [uncultured Nocardioides sp.]|uniref:GNAT family N-acetyltransferase n=1 Tax=uncultured Nocardioides sp. TaxID=198441 RepID=UPI00262E9209|nr:GNAT family N-acetyltransferase [uncultured Nocardioides sp.]